MANKGPLIVTSTTGAPTFRPLQGGGPLSPVTNLQGSQPQGSPLISSYRSGQVSGTAGIDDLDSP